MNKIYVIAVGILLVPMTSIQACCSAAAVAPEVDDPTKTEKFERFLSTADDSKLYCVLSVITQNKLDYYDISKYKQWELPIKNAISNALRERKALLAKVEPVRMSVSLVALIPPAATQTSSPQPSPIKDMPEQRYEISVSNITLPGALVPIPRLSPRWQYHKQKRRCWSE